MRARFSVPAIALGCCLFAAPALAQNADTAQPAQGQVLGTVQNGNLTIVFEAANSSDINVGMYQAWDEFAQANTKIARQLTRHPSLLSDDNYLRRHPELAGFFGQHPDVKSAMIANPGNFLPV
jgi:hypothetical protein